MAYDERVGWLPDELIDCSRVKKIIFEIVIEHSDWELTYDSKELAWLYLDGHPPLVLTMWEYESMMFEVVVKG